jgi:hypothetical protein
MGTKTALEDLTYWDALERLFPWETLSAPFPSLINKIKNQKELELPSGWREGVSPPKLWPRGNRPERETDELKTLDEAIEALIGRASTEARVSKVECPYFSARRGIAFAVEHARLTVLGEESRKSKRLRLQKAEKQLLTEASWLKDLAAIMSEPCDELSKEDAAPTEEFGIGRPDKEAIVVATLTARKALDTIASTNLRMRLLVAEGIAARLTIAELFKAERERLPAPSNKRHLRVEGFVQALGLVYYDLTGRTPTNSTTGDFFSFTNAALGAIADTELEEKTFRSAIARIKGGTLDGKVVQARPEWDRFDRYSYADQKPTAAEVAAAQAEYANDRTRRYLAWEAEMRKIAQDRGLDADRTENFVKMLREPRQLNRAGRGKRPKPK